MSSKTKQQRRELEEKVKEQFQIIQEQHRNFKNLKDAYNQLKEDKNVIRLDRSKYQELKIYEAMYKAEKRRNRRFKKEKDKLVELVKKLQEEQRSVHNVRGAGRKQKTTQEIRAEIRKLYKDGNHSMNKLSKEFNLSKGTIYNILHE